MTTFSPIKIDCFKAYDIRGELGVTLDTHVAYRVGRAFAQFLGAAEAGKPIVVGCDIRASSEEIKAATIEGITDAGADVIDLGMTGTEEVYFATSHFAAAGGIEVTASHNPINYNGLKMVREDSKPIGQDTGLADVRAIAEAGNFSAPKSKGKVKLNADKSAYIAHLFTFIDASKITPLKVVVNPGNGSAAPSIDLIETKLKEAGAPVEFVKMHYAPDGSFPHGIPNPMIVENQQATSERVLATQADLGIAFDGDFDRCFFFDETGAFIEGYYVVGLLAQAFLDSASNSDSNNENNTSKPAIVYDPRVIWNTEDIIEQAGGRAVMSQSGHSFMKAVMREHDAIYGGEMSAHHYFRDFFYCDSGMIPWLLVIQLLSTSNKPLSQLVGERIKAFPSSGERNFRLSNMTANDAIAQVEAHFSNEHDAQSSGENAAPQKTTIDGLSLDFDDWRFNLRASNTEPLIRLNVETRGDEALLAEKLGQIQQFLADLGAQAA